jgi:hypothetical protein
VGGRNVRGPEPVEHGPRIGRVHGDQQRPGSQQAEGIEAQHFAELPAGGEDRNGLPADPQADAGRIRHLVQGGGEAAFGGVVHGMDPGDGTGCTRRLEDRDAGAIEQRGCAGHRFRIHAASQQRLGVFPRQQRRTLDGDRACQQDGVTRSGARRAQHAFARHGAEQAAHKHRPVEIGGDFSVAAHQRDVDLLTRAAELGKQPLDGLLGRAVRQQRRHQQPAWFGSDRRQVVAVYGQQVARGVLAGKGDGIGFGHQQLGPAEIDHGSVLADSGTHDHGGIAAGNYRKEPGEEPGGQFAGSERHRDIIRQGGMRATGACQVTEGDCAG